MKLCVAGVLGILGLSSAAWAQPATTAARGYVAGVAQSAVGDVTSQSFGLEGGWYRTPNVAIFVELGAVRDTAPATIGPAAQLIAGHLARNQSAPVSYSVKQPVGFISGGVRYERGGQRKIRPYVLGTVGVARVTRDVTFALGDKDVTGTLATYGVVLGTDLAGSTSDPMVTFGGGAAWKPRGAWVIDAGYRFSRIIIDTASTSLSRIGLGIGYTF